MKIHARPCCIEHKACMDSVAAVSHTIVHYVSRAVGFWLAVQMLF